MLIQKITIFISWIIFFIGGITTILSYPYSLFYWLKYKGKEPEPDLEYLKSILDNFQKSIDKQDNAL